MEFKMIDLMESVDASSVFPEEAPVLDPGRIRDLTLSRLPEKPRRRTAPRLLLAAAIAAALSVSALGYAGFQKYGKSREMLDGFFGNREQKSIVDAETPAGPLPDSFRVELDPQAAALVEPCIAGIEKTVRSGDLSLTVHGNLYDSVTGCGILYYTLEMPEDRPCKVGIDGCLLDLPIYSGTRHGYSYLLRESSREGKLSIAEYYIRGPHDREPYIEIGLDPDRGPMTREEEFDRVQSAIQIPLEDGGGLPGLVGGGVRLSPIGLYLDQTGMDFLTEEEKDRIPDPLKIRFRDGSEYLISDSGTQNYIFAAGYDSSHTVVPLNRLVDVNQVDAVIIGSEEIRDLVPIADDQRWRYGPYVDQRGRLDGLDSIPTGSIRQGDLTLIPGKLRYSDFTGQGSFTCTLRAKDPAGLIENGHFLSPAAGLQSNHLIHWVCQKQSPGELALTGYFLRLDPESRSLKLWFAGSRADPRLEVSTENLLCLPLEDPGCSGIELAEGGIRVSELGLVIDYGTLGISQGSVPRDLSLEFSDGSRKILSSWDEDILDCFWVDGNILLENPDRKLYVGFPEPVDPAKIRAVFYAGRTFRPDPSR